jgi:hypothetical protein
MRRTAYQLDDDDVSTLIVTVVPGTTWTSCSEDSTIARQQRSPAYLDVGGGQVVISANSDSVKNRANMKHRWGRHHVGSSRENAHAAGAAASAVTATETARYSQAYW